MDEARCPKLLWHNLHLFLLQKQQQFLLPYDINTCIIQSCIHAA